MKSKIFTASLIASAMFGGAFALPALAQTNTPQIERAQQSISARIQEGMRTGQITPSEAQYLLRRERDLETREAQFKSDGRATPQERQALRAELVALGQEVERMMANADAVRPGSANTPGIDNRRAEIARRIDEGVRQGYLSQRDARRLHRREQEIAQHEAQAKRDGVVTQQERRQLRDELANLRDDVERMIDRRGRG
ncbi:MAG: hypothetical protein V4731_14900 [Pseudomonadota bacterium]